MIMLIKEKDKGKGCLTCRFRNGEKCIADERVDIHRNGEIDKYRPYCCPFRYYESECKPICKCFDGMTEEETKGWFEGADWFARRYVRLEMERDNYTGYKANEALKEEEQ